MLTAEKYALALIFYALIGNTQGVTGAYFEAYYRGDLTRHKGFYVFGGAIALIYAFLGIGSFDGGHAIYLYLPPLLIWWGGLVLGKSLFPVQDRMIGIPLTVGLGGAVALFHFWL